MSTLSLCIREESQLAHAATRADKIFGRQIHVGHVDSSMRHSTLGRQSVPITDAERR
jgi:hypothetical protein